MCVGGGGGGGGGGEGHKKAKITFEMFFKHIFYVMLAYIPGNLGFYRFIGVAGGHALVQANFYCWSGLLIWMIVGQGPTVLTAGVGGGGVFGYFSIINHFYFLSASLWEMA